jgi:hypothetical protein
MTTQNAGVHNLFVSQSLQPMRTPLRRVHKYFSP